MLQPIFVHPNRPKASPRPCTSICRHGSLQERHRKRPLQYDHLGYFNFLICGNHNLFRAYRHETHFKITIPSFYIVVTK